MTGTSLELPIGAVSAESSLRKNALLLFGILQLLDLVTTLAAFSHGGVELNPLIRSLIPLTGNVLAILISKMLLMVLTCRFGRRLWTIQFGIGFYTCVVLWNVIVFAVLR